jgi:hypothetical protein
MQGELTDMKDGTTEDKEGSLAIREGILERGRGWGTTSQAQPKRMLINELRELAKEDLCVLSNNIGCESHKRGVRTK